MPPTENMIKVCHMTSAHPPGDVRIFQKECTSLAQNGYDVFLVEQGDSYESNGVKIVGTGKTRSGRIQRAILATRDVYKKAKDIDADIYHFHDPELLIYGLKLKKKGKKVVFDSHEFYREQIRGKEYLPNIIAKIVATIYTVVEDYVLARIDGVIFPCTKNGQHPFQGKCRNVAVVNNTPKLHELYDQYDPSIKRNDASACYIGSLTHARGVTNAVIASNKAGVTLYLGGLFDSEDYQREIQSLPEYKNVVYLGLLDRTQVVETLQSCRIGMANLLNVGQYNTFDNLPTKVYEYMSLGVPVIFSKSKYNDEVVDKYKFGITVDPNNIDDIAGAMRLLIDNPERAELMGENGRIAVRDVFNWNQDYDNMNDLYTKILDESSC